MLAARRPESRLAASGLSHGHLRTIGNRPLPGGAGCVLNDLAFPGHFRRAVLHGQPRALLDIRVRMLGFHPGVVSGISPAVDRRHMRRSPAEIRPPDSKLLAVCIDPFPEFFGGSPSLVACRAVD